MKRELRIFIRRLTLFAAIAGLFYVLAFIAVRVDDKAGFEIAAIQLPDGTPCAIARVGGLRDVTAMSCDWARKSNLMDDDKPTIFTPPLVLPRPELRDPFRHSPLHEPPIEKPTQQPMI